MLASSPRGVLALFDQPVALPGSGLAIADAGGTRHDRGGTTRGQVDAASLAVDLPELPPGRYTVTWRVASEADGEFNQGSFDFTVGPELGSLMPSGAQLGGLGLVVLVLGALFMLGGDRGRHNRAERFD